VSLALQTLSNDNVSKVMEVFLDFLEFLISSLAEAIFNNISDILKISIKLIQSKKDNINQKANDIINISQEILTADVLLPNLIGILEEICDDPNQLGNKVSSLEVLNGLLKK